MRLRSSLLLATAALLLAAAPASAVSLSLVGKLALADFQALNGTGATYGPPNGANYTDGPITVNSGDPTDLFAGNNPGRDDVEQLLFTVAIDPADLAALGTVDFEIGGVGMVSFAAADFFDPATAGFPANINGIGNGEVNGIKFPDAVVAGVLFDVDFTGAVTDGDIGDVEITSPVNARGDIFGIGLVEVDDEVFESRIIKNSPNSHAIGITAPEPAGLALIGALAALVARRRK
jgi:hypothetical protein